MLNLCKTMTMKRFIYATLAIVLVACTTDLEDVRVADSTASSDKILNSSTNCIKGSLLVRFGASAESRLTRCAARGGATRTGIEGVDAILDNVSGYAVEPVFMVTEKNREKVYERGLHLWYELRFDEACDLDSVAAELSKVAEVERVQFSEAVSRIAQPKSTLVPQVKFNGGSIAPPSKEPNPFNDTYYEYQWSLKNRGKSSKVTDGGYVENLPTVVTGADIKVLPAWKLCKGDPSIVVAVVDEAVMYDHEDLAANMWVNAKEIPGDEEDNDGN